MKDCWVYLEALLSYWLSGYWFITAIPEVLSYVAPESWFGGASRWLDIHVKRETRRKTYLCIATFGLLAASFFAWDQQYRIAISRSPEALSNQLDSLKRSNLDLQSQLAAVKAELWMPLTKAQVRQLTAALRPAHIGRVSIMRPDTPDCARVASQIAKAFQDAGTTLTDAPFHSLDGEGFGVSITVGPNVRTAQIVQAAFSRALGTTVSLVRAGKPLRANDKPTDLAVVLGLRVVH